MSIFNKEIDKIKNIRDQEAKVKQDAEEYEAFKMMSFSEQDKLRETDFSKWIAFTESEVAEGNHENPL